MQTINIENVVNSAMKEISRGQKLLSQAATDRLAHMNKIKLKLNDKTPINKWKCQTNQFKTIDDKNITSVFRQENLITSLYLTLIK